MVSDCSNHHFVDSPEKGPVSTQVKKCWSKKVQQEWNILADDIPETIYVYVFEERMNLIHSVIISAPGTPYLTASSSLTFSFLQNILKNPRWCTTNRVGFE